VKDASYENLARRIENQISSSHFEMNPFATKILWISFLHLRHAEPIRLTYRERMRIVMVNDTMMMHPIHLHGMCTDLVSFGSEMRHVG